MTKETKVPAEKKWSAPAKTKAKAVPAVAEKPPVYSTADPMQKVSGIPSMSFQRNQYEKDIFKAAAEKLGLSVNAYLRQAGLEKAAKLKIY